jgi:hypothetical protein
MEGVIALCLGCFNHMERVPSTHWTGGLVDHRTGLEALPLLGIKPPFLGHPTCRLVTIVSELSLSSKTWRDTHTDRHCAADSTQLFINFQTDLNIMKGHRASPSVWIEFYRWLCHLLNRIPRTWSTSCKDHFKGSKNMCH